MSADDDLLNKMIGIMDNEKKIRNHLKEVIPSYKKRAYDGLSFIEDIIKY